MLEPILYICCFNAFLMKVLSKQGFFYDKAKYFKLWLLEIFFTPKRTAPKYSPKVEYFIKCVPCRMAILLGLPQTVGLGFWYGEFELKILFLPLVIGVISSLAYRNINPNHEE